MKKPGILYRFKLWLTASSIFTFVGVCVLFAALIILIRSLVMRNSYEILLACGILLLMLIIGITGFWKSRKLKSLTPGWKPPYPMTAAAPGQAGKMIETTQITGLISSIPFFFRLHFFIKGNFSPSGYSKQAVKKKTFSGGCPVFIETSIPRGDTSAQVTFELPMSGIFQGEGYCKLRDIFGFFSFSCGEPHPETIKVRSAPCFGKKNHVNTQSGAEDRRNKPSADEERYYMREYTPGDRLRDINWKSSDRIDTLITRISTDNQEKINRIEVHFRNYCRIDNHGKQGISLEALWLLDRAKARLVYFLRSLMEQNSSFVFDVYASKTQGGEQQHWEIEDMDTLDAFFDDLAGLSFAPLQNEPAAETNKGELYIFSTACDLALPGFLLTCNQRPVTLFISQPETDRSKSSLLKIPKMSNTEIEFLKPYDFYSKGCFISPRCFTSGKIKPLSVSTNKMEINYAEIKV